MRRLTLLILAAALAAACTKDEPEAKPEPAATKPAATKPAATTPEPAPATAVVGKPAPDFTLKDLDGKEHSLAAHRGKTVVLEWFNPKCPFVEKSHTVGSLVGTARKHIDGGVVWLAINSGAAGKQGHDPALNVEAATAWQLPHPILRDETGDTGRAYGATNTPHMFVIDPSGTLVYAGAIDNSPDGEGKSPTDGALVNYVDAALTDLAAGRPVAIPQTKAYGCGVKYAS